MVTAIFEKVLIQIIAGAVLMVLLAGSQPVIAKLQTKTILRRIRHIILIIFVIVWIAPLLYFVRSYLLKVPIQPPVLSLVLFASATQITLAYLFWLLRLRLEQVADLEKSTLTSCDTTGKSPDNSEINQPASKPGSEKSESTAEQIRTNDTTEEIQYDPSPVKIPSEHGPPIEVCRLNDPQATYLKLNWTTFHHGVERLVDQINGAGGVQPHLFIGINQTGTIMAAILRARLPNARNHLIVSLKTCRRNRKITIEDVPLPVVSEPIILIADCQIQKGDTLKKVVDFLETKYPRASILKTVLVASHVQKDIASIPDLEPRVVLPDFFAFTCAVKVRLLGYMT